MKTKVGVLSLGCARNLVDTEVMLGYLSAAGFTVSPKIEQANVAIVNTCCFIQEAQEESIDAILSLSRLKKTGQLAKIVVCGCLVQRHQRQLMKQLPEVDAFIDVGSIAKIADVLLQVLNQTKPAGEFSQPNFLYTHNSPRLLLTPQHFAYIKISEGCNNRCSYCIIPTLRGAFRSRTIDSVIQEADVLLQKQDVSEINLIGQDTTLYGQDLYGQKRLSQLLLKISEKAEGRWLRLLYTHPAHFSKELIAVIKHRRSICKYIDLPLQHINDKILRQMNRRTSRYEILTLLESLRARIPGLAIRTTLIVGFPGESDRQFAELLDFIRQARFERLGLFKYSRETKTPAYNFPDQIPEKVKQDRFEQALSLQRQIASDINAGFLRKTLKVLIDEADPNKENGFLGRTEYDAPEVDGCVYVLGESRLKAGDFVQVKITDTLEYDLVGEVIESGRKKGRAR